MSRSVTKYEDINQLKAPYIFDDHNPEDVRLLARLRKTRGVSVLDHAEQQVSEIVKIPVINRKYKTYEYNWIYFPWRKLLYRCVKRDIYLAIKGSRNLYILNEEEQEKLYKLHIAIAGMSVGSAVASVLALENIGGTLTIADNDIVSISNLNRLRTGVTNLGRRKVEVASEELYEINPYLQIRQYDEGVTQENVDDFLSQPKPDVVIEETDDLSIKATLRSYAKKHSVPLIMATTIDSNLLVDFEDYRKESTPLFNGILTDDEIRQLSSLDLTKKADGAKKILGDAFFTERVANTFQRLGRDVNAFPQLASGAYLRASAISQLIRIVFVGADDVLSGRYHFDLKRMYLTKL